MQIHDENSIVLLRLWIFVFCRSCIILCLYSQFAACQCFFIYQYLTFNQLHKDIGSDLLTDAVYAYDHTSVLCEQANLMLQEFIIDV